MAFVNHINNSFRCPCGLIRKNGSQDTFLSKEERYSLGILPTGDGDRVLLTYQEGQPGVDTLNFLGFTRAQSLAFIFPLISTPVPDAWNRKCQGGLRLCPYWVFWCLVWLIWRPSTVFLTLPEVLSNFRAGSLHQEVRLETVKESTIRKETSQKMLSCFHYLEAINLWDTYRWAENGEERKYIRHEIYRSSYIQPDRPQIWWP